MSTTIPYFLDGSTYGDAEILWELKNTDHGGYLAVLYVPSVGYVWTETETRVSEQPRFSFDDFTLTERWMNIDRADLVRLCAALVPALLNHSNDVIDRLYKSLREANQPKVVAQ